MKMPLPLINFTLRALPELARLRQHQGFAVLLYSGTLAVTVSEPIQGVQKPGNTLLQPFY